MLPKLIIQSFLQLKLLELLLKVLRLSPFTFSEFTNEIHKFYCHHLPLPIVPSPKYLQSSRLLTIIEVRFVLKWSEISIIF